MLLWSLVAAAIARADGDGAAAAAPSAAPANDGWELVERDDRPGAAYELWARLPTGSKWRAYRLTGDVDVPPPVALEVAMDVCADESRAAGGEKRRVLRRTPDVIVTYVRADLPMVADRDVTTHLERSRDSGRGEYELVWREANDEGPPPEAGVVRMQVARGRWLFQPLDGGRTHVVFESHADLGGSLPAWLIDPFIAGTIKSNLANLRAAIARRTN